jgi:aqualysin 1
LIYDVILYNFIIGLPNIYYKDTIIMNNTKKYTTSTGKFICICIYAFINIMSLPIYAQNTQNTKTLPVIIELHENEIQKTKTYIKNDTRVFDSDWNYISQKMMGSLQNIETKHGFKAKHAFNKVFKGLAADLTPAQIEELKLDKRVKNIEVDHIMHTNAQSIPWGITQVNAHLSSSLAGNGAGVTQGANVYVIDTGGVKTHADLTTQTFKSFGFKNIYDCNGHGTHVAGTIGATDNSGYVVGVAPSIPYHALKVLGCTGSGSTSNIIKAIDWVSNYGIRPSVINMSLGGSISSALDTSVQNAVNQGITIVVAAGNSGANACNTSPARMGVLNGVITVAATNTDGSEAYFSNYGNCVDVWAPGVGVLSTDMNGSVSVKSGTSMASPHVAGIAALYYSKFPLAAPNELEQAIKTDAVLNGLLSKDGIAIKLANAMNY